MEHHCPLRNPQETGHIACVIRTHSIVQDVWEKAVVVLVQEEIV